MPYCSPTVTRLGWLSIILLPLSFPICLCFSVSAFTYCDFFTLKVYRVRTVSQCSMQLCSHLRVYWGCPIHLQLSTWHTWVKETSDGKFSASDSPVGVSEGGPSPLWVVPFLSRCPKLMKPEVGQVSEQCSPVLRGLASVPACGSCLEILPWHPGLWPVTQATLSSPGCSWSWCSSQQ